jgi:hypothetical protein
VLLNCGCFSVLIIERVTEEDYKAASQAQTWKNHPVMNEVYNYCRKKYLNLPDVTAIRKKEW